MKRRFILYSANLMAAVMDAGIGMLIAALISTAAGVTLPWYGLMLGAMFALLPDLDLVPSVLWRGVLTFDHRQTLFHRPLLFIPLVTAVTYLMGGSVWASIAFTAVLWHFLHDTNFLDDTYGVAWFWPFSNHFWSLRGAFPPPLLQPHEDWLHEHWLRPTLVSVRELGIGSLSALVAGRLTGVASVEVVVPFVVFVVGVGLVWWLAAERS